MYFSIKFFKNQINFFFLFLNSIYFKAIQTEVFYQKNTFKMFRPIFLMFLDPEVSCD